MNTLIDMAALQARLVVWVSDSSGKPGAAISGEDLKRIARPEPAIK